MIDRVGNTIVCAGLRTFLLASVIVAGCAMQRPLSEIYRFEIEAAERGDFQVAENSLGRKASAGDLDAMVVLGVLYYEKMGRQNQGINLITLAARRGSTNAQQVLASMGKPVPAPDLARRSSSTVICNVYPIVGLVCTSN